MAHLFLRERSNKGKESEVGIGKVHASPACRNLDASSNSRHYAMMLASVNRCFEPNSKAQKVVASYMKTFKPGLCPGSTSQSFPRGCYRTVALVSRRPVLSLMPSLLRRRRPSLQASLLGSRSLLLQIVLRALAWLLLIYPSPSHSG